MSNNFLIVFFFATAILLMNIIDMVDDYKKVDSIVALIESHIVVRAPITFIAYFGILIKTAEWFVVMP